MIDLSINKVGLEHNIQKAKENHIIIPTIAQMQNPDLIPEKIKAKLSTTGLWDVDPVNLFRISWHNEAKESGGLFQAVPNYVEIPTKLSGVPCRIVAMSGKWFPTGCHKVGASFGCLAPRLVTGQFDATYHHAVWPSTGNYCRGGAFNSKLLACDSVAILPQDMSKERFDWLKSIAGQIIATPGCESNVKEIFDKTWELKKDPSMMIFNQFAEMGQALEVLYALWQLDEISGMQGAQILQTTLCAAIDRTLWLCESNGRPDEKEFHAHLHSWQALCHILRDLHSGVNLPGVSLSAAVALLERRSQAIHAPALDRGAALGALMRLEHPNASAEAALTMLAQLSPAQSGEALHGLLALARHQLACQPAFIAGFSSHLNQLSDDDFINALPDLRAAMAWLPPRERGTLAHQVLEHYQLAQLPISALQMPLHCPPQAIAHHQQLEQQALASLQHWGVFHV